MALIPNTPPMVVQAFDELAQMCSVVKFIDLDFDNNPIESIDTILGATDKELTEQNAETLYKLKSLSQIVRAFIQ